MNEIVTLGSDELQIEVWTLGARLNGVWFQGQGNLVDGAASMEEALGPKKYSGATVGPMANRIAGGSATIDDRTCQFERNEADKTTLHSGAAGVHAKTWTIDAQNDRLLILKLELPDGDGGFPGVRSLSVQFEVIGAALRVHYTANTTAPTWMNLALHPYWCLGQSGRAGQRIQVKADRYTPVDADKIPTGEVADVSGTHFDLRRLDEPSHEIDHNFCLNENDPPAVVLESDSLRLTTTTDAPGVQIFTGKESGIAIEPQHWPDAMHHPAFPSVELCQLGQYRQTSFYQFDAL